MSAEPQFTPQLMAFADRLRRTLRDQSVEDYISSLDPVRELQRQISGFGPARRWAARHGLSPAYVSDVLNRRREPGAAILNALGLERVVTYRRVPEMPTSGMAALGAVHSGSEGEAEAPGETKNPTPESKG